MNCVHTVRGVSKRSVKMSCLSFKVTKNTIKKTNIDNNGKPLPRKHIHPVFLPLFKKLQWKSKNDFLISPFRSKIQRKPEDL